MPRQRLREQGREAAAIRHLLPFINGSFVSVFFVLIIQSITYLGTRINKKKKEFFYYILPLQQQKTQHVSN
jgi:hypothetical protein